jgi:GNAT superfamily N-acetyltransferase
LPAFQSTGIGRSLVHAVVKAAGNAGRTLCWCIPRETNVMFFEMCGFVPMSNPTTIGMEFGPNVYMARAISLND